MTLPIGDVAKAANLILANRVGGRCPKSRRTTWMPVAHIQREIRRRFPTVTLMAAYRAVSARP